MRLMKSRRRRSIAHARYVVCRIAPYSVAVKRFRPAVWAPRHHHHIDVVHIYCAGINGSRLGENVAYPKAVYKAACNILRVRCTGCAVVTMSVANNTLHVRAFTCALYLPQEHSLDHLTRRMSV